MIKNLKKCGLLVLMSLMVCTFALSFTVQSVSAADSAFEAQLTSEGFPESYKVYLRKLHEAHPTWTFKAKLLNYTWDAALGQQCANAAANTISVNYPDAYKAIKDGTYNFDTHTYIPKDGASWVAASEAAVAYYMDPRNWLIDSGIFMFESYTYNSAYQTEDIVKKILSATALPETASAYYMAAAQQSYNGTNYSISPVYLAAKTRIELGSSDFMVNGHEFTYGGKTYANCYNPYNIGSVDSADGSAATKGLVYAAGGSDGSGTSYLRPWNTLEKAVKGGAIYIADNFILNNQYSLYYERFNVLNGLSAMGTHQYATSVFNAATLASITYSNYKDMSVLEESFVFEIPVFQDMPDTAAASPLSGGDNNCYLDSITLSANGKSLSYTPQFNRFTGTYTLSEAVGSSINKLTITTTKNAEGAVVTISGNQLSEGSNKITIKCTSSSGLTSKSYYINVTKDSSKTEEPQDPDKNASIIQGVEKTTIEASAEQGDGYVQLSWAKSAGYKMDAYEVFKTTKSTFDEKAYFTTSDGSKTSYKNNKELTKGTRYYYKVRGKRTIDGVTYYSQWSNTLSVDYNAGETPVDPNADLIQGVMETTIKASSEQGSGYIKLSWEKSAGYKMDYYQVFRSEKKDEFDEMPYFTTTDGSKTSYKNTKSLTKGTRYYYKVRGVRVIDGNTYYSTWSNLAYRTYNAGVAHAGLVSGVENTTLTISSAIEDGGIRISWAKSAGYKVDYYQVFRSETSQSYGETPFFTTTDGSKITYKNTKSLTKGKTYYYKVRGVRVIDGVTYYTTWSPQTSQKWK